MDIELRVMVNGHYGSYRANVKLDELQRQCFEPKKTTDMPEFALIGDEIMQGGEAEQIVIMTRKDAAEILAKELSEIIINAMKQNDTCNGYPENKGDVNE